MFILIVVIILFISFVWSIYSVRKELGKNKFIKKVKKELSLGRVVYDSSSNKSSGSSSSSRRGRE